MNINSIWDHHSTVITPSKSSRNALYEWVTLSAANMFLTEEFNIFCYCFPPNLYFFEFFLAGYARQSTLT